MTFHVHISDMTLFDTLQVVASLRFTGRMTVVAKSKIARLGLVKGRLVEASVDGVPRVGERLLRERTISTADLQAALARQTDGMCEVPVGLLVSTMGLADARQVRPIVLAQLKEACAEILTWRDGSVDLAGDPELKKLESQLPQIEISSLLLEAAYLEDLSNEPDHDMVDEAEAIDAALEEDFEVADDDTVDPPADEEAEQPDADSTDHEVNEPV